RLALLSKPRWFTEEEDRDGEGICPVLIPDKMADLLGITVQRVNSSPPVIDINGTRFRVVGVFSSQSLGELRDLDGRDMLPIDVESMGELVTIDGHISAGDEDPRIDPARIIITPMRAVFNNVNSSSVRTVSMSVTMNDEGYSAARGEIESFLEQTGRRVYYGLDGVSYRGRRARATTMGGLIDLLIPLLIAGLTVLNTMKGSVYERQSEIFVYNAVGIAPRYVFFMFIAEAFVYAVVGSVLGYLLSQGTGRVLTMLDMTGGLNMTYASLATIYASLTIAAAVFLSTYYPAKSAMEIAAPAEESGWSLPEPDGDELEFDLPFNFSTHGRIAVLVFFDRYLRDNGEGSAGRFFAGVPHIGVREDDGEGMGSYVPLIQTTIWLKPFDLAVCQRMTITMPPDPETGQYKASVMLERISGTREAWMRLNRGFVALIRQHFLHWRAVSDAEREEMYQEARGRLREGVLEKSA
ncbi:MAG: FtsX-like permease family protein, partial [Chitinivibrionales bacterium]|nr:FtsX-like permease family protein [Chitinivibrionales bacterium]